MRRSSLSWKRSCRKLHSLHSSEAMWSGQPRFLCDCPPFLSAISIPEPGPLRKWRRCPRPAKRPSESFHGNLLRSHHRWQWQTPSLRRLLASNRVSERLGRTAQATSIRKIRSPNNLVHCNLVDVDTLAPMPRTPESLFALKVDDALDKDEPLLLLRRHSKPD